MTALQVKPKVVFGLNSRFSQIAGNPSKTIKLHVGLDYDKKVRFELGYNYMPVASVDVIYPTKSDTIRRTNKLGYLGLQAEYTFYRKKNWKLSVPLQVGIGGNRRTERINQGTRVISTHTVMPIEGGANALYYFYDWLGVKAGMGYRLSFGKSFTTLSGSYYNLGIAFFAGELYNRLKK